MKIVILSRNIKLYSTSRLVEAAQARGHEVEVIDHTKCYMSIEHDEPKIFIGDREIRDIDAIIPRIGAGVTFYGSSIIRQFEMQKVFSTTTSLALLRSRDKLRSLQILSKANVGIPKTAFAKKYSDIKNLLSSVGGTPVVIKLLQSTQGKGVVLAETQKAATSVLEAFFGLEANIILQEFIKEAKAEDIRALIVDGKVIGAMKRKGKADDFRSNLHKGGVAEPYTLKRKEASVAIKAANAMGLKIAGVDLLLSNRGPLVLEVNSSPGLDGIEKSTGKDIAGKIIEYVENNYQISHLRKRDKIGV